MMMLTQSSRVLQLATTLRRLLVLAFFLFDFTFIVVEASDFNAEGVSLSFPHGTLCKRDDPHTMDFNGHDPKWTGYSECRLILYGGRDGLALAWSVRGNYLEFFLEKWISLIGWVSIGINDNPGMRGLDMFVLYYDKDFTPHVEDRYAHTFTIPRLDKQQDVELLGQWDEDGIIRTWFRRPLDSCDPNGEDKRIVTIKDPFTGEKRGHPYYIAWALGHAGGYSFSGLKHRFSGSFRVNFYSPNLYTIGPSPKNFDNETSGNKSRTWKVRFPDFPDGHPVDSFNENNYWCVVKKLDHEVLFQDTDTISLVEQLIYPGKHLRGFSLYACSNHPEPRGKDIYRCELPHIYEQCADLQLIQGWVAGGAETSYQHIPPSGEEYGECSKRRGACVWREKYDPETGFNVRWNPAKYFVYFSHYYQYKEQKSMRDNVTDITYTYTPFPQKSHLGTLMIQPMKFQFRDAGLEKSNFPKYNFKYPNLIPWEWLASKNPKQHVSMICDCGPRAAFSPGVDVEDMWVVAVSHHTGFMGDSMHTFVIREGAEGKSTKHTLLETRTHDAVYHQPRSPVRFRLKPGDKIAITCTFNLAGHGWGEFAHAPMNVVQGSRAEDERCLSMLTILNLPGDFFLCSKWMTKGHEDVSICVPEGDIKQAYIHPTIYPNRTAAANTLSKSPAPKDYVTLLGDFMPDSRIEYEPEQHTHRLVDDFVETENPWNPAYGNCLDTNNVGQMAINSSNDSLKSAFPGAAFAKVLFLVFFS